MNTYKLRNIQTKTVACENCSLSKLCLPRNLTNPEIDILENAIEKTTKLKKKEHLFKSGDKMTNIYAIKSGAIKTSIANTHGNEQILGFHLPGDLVGFDGFSASTHSIDAEALDDTMVCALPVKELDRLCDLLPVIREEILHQVGDTLQSSNRMILTLGQMQTDERLANFLLTLSEHHAKRNFSRHEFQLSMSRRDIANYLGMAVETLSRLFSKFQDNAWISANHKTIILKDVAKLNDIAHRSCIRC